MRKLVLCAAALSGFAFQASAADLISDAASMKDPLPDTIQAYGVTFYGTIDVGGAYQSHGAPETGAFYTALDYVPYKPATASSQGAIVGNALEQSKVGIKIEELIGYGFTAVGKLQTEFNPWSGELADACASFVRGAEQLAALATNHVGTVESFQDGARCGQAFQLAYAGVSSSVYGTLTLGRQNSLVNDAISTYDPMHASYAFSLIGFSGGALGGIGSTETTKWDNSIKYLFTYGPLHAAAMYSSGGEDTAIMQEAAGANVGFTYKGLSVDGFYTMTDGAVNLSNLAAYNTTYGTWLKSTVTDNEAWTIMGKYTLDVPALFGYYGGFKDCGFKDECAESAKLTVFGGYNHTDMANDASFNGTSTHATALGVLTTVGGYTAVYGAGNGDIYTTDRILETSWVGATYQTGPWAFTGAYYYETQNHYELGTSLGTCTTAASNPSKNCSGTTEMISFLVDYTFNKHFDIYAGLSYVDLSGGFANGVGIVPIRDTTNVVTGLRLKF